MRCPKWSGDCRTEQTGTMRIALLLGLLLALSACASSVTGNGALPQPLANSFSNAWAVQDAHAERLYAGGPNVNEVDFYAAFVNNPPPRGRIVYGLDAPTGMAVDQSGNVYVCNNAGQSGPGKSVFWTVTVYHRGGADPFRTYTDGVFSPVDVAVASNKTVYVANYSSAVTVYPPHSLQHSATLHAPAGYAPIGVALDSGGNVFVSYVPKLSGGGLIYKYKPGQTRGSNLRISFTGSPHGIAIDSSGNMIVAVSNAPNSGSQIEVFAPGRRHPKLVMSGPFQPFMLNLSHNEERLFVADYGSGNNDGGVFVYAYPKGTLLYKDTQGVAAGGYGVALDPP